MAPTDRNTQIDDLGERIAAGIAKGMSENAPKRVRPGSSAFDPHTPFRSKNGPTLKGDVYQNGIRLNQDQLTDREITAFNAITRSGRYCDRLVEVIVSDDAGARVVLFRYTDKSVDQRIEMMSHWRTLQELLDIIVKGQNALVTA